MKKVQLFLMSKTNLARYLNTNLASLRTYSTDLPADIKNQVKTKFEIDEPTIGRTRAEQEYLYVMPPELPENPKILKISILGVPNSGKSTLVNRLLNRRICSVSSKINTTRNKITGVLTDKDTQLLILDTPGLMPLRRMKKKFNIERSMIVDPHSSLWEADLVCVVHDVSDDYSRNRIDKEVLKCLFAHPEKESLLILNKIDKLKKKNILFDLVADLTGGYLNGKVFLSKDKMKPASRNTLGDFDYESLFAKTAEKMNIKLEDKSEKHKSIVKLLDELKKCEDFLIKNLEDIQIKDENDLLADIEKKDLAKTEEKPKASALQTLKEQRMTLEKLKGSNKQVPMKLSSDNKSISNDLNLVQSIAESTPVDPSAPAIRRIEDISPFDFKQDLLQTTDWHLYYKKLSTLGLFVREKSHWPYFNQVFMVSSLLNDGVEELKRYLLSRAKPGDWVFTRNFLTDQMPQEIAEMCVREKLLENLPDEVPYLLGLETAFWEVDDHDCLNIAIKIMPGSKSWHFKRHLSILFSNKANVIRKIKQEAHQELMNIFRCEVKLRLIIVTDRDQLKS